MLSAFLLGYLSIDHVSHKTDYCNTCEYVYRGHYLGAAKHVAAYRRGDDGRYARKGRQKEILPYLHIGKSYDVGQHILWRSGNEKQQKRQGVALLWIVEDWQGIGVGVGEKGVKQLKSQLSCQQNGDYASKYRPHKHEYRAPQSAEYKACRNLNKLAGYERDNDLKCRYKYHNDSTERVVFANCVANKRCIGEVFVHKNNAYHGCRNEKRGHDAQNCSRFDFIAFFVSLCCRVDIFGFGSLVFYLIHTFYAGRVTVKVLPCPNLLSTCIFPRASVIIL